MDTRGTIWTLCVCLCLIQASLCQDVEFDTNPENLGKKTGERVDFVCDYTGNENKQWLEAATSGSAVPLMFNGVINTVHPFRTSYTAVGTNFAIISTNTTFAGEYKCNNVNGGGRGAFLIVLESDPTCTTNVTGSEIEVDEFVSVTCEVGYKGLWSPKMTWKDSNGVTVTPEDSSTSNLLKQDLIYQVKDSDTSIQYSVEVTFPAPPNGVLPADSPGLFTYAKNAPTEKYSTQSNSYTVVAAPSNHKLEPSAGDLLSGSTLKCAANGKPTPDISIFNGTEDKIISNNGELLITEEMVNPDIQQTIGCIAKNTIKGKERKSVIDGNFTIKMAPTTTTSTTTTTTTVSTIAPSSSTKAGGSTEGGGLSSAALAGIIVGAVLAVVIILVIVIVCYRKNKTTKEKTYDTEKPKNSNHAYVPEVRGVQGQPNDYKGYDDPKQRNAENLTYADLELDNRPRSRAPVKTMYNIDDSTTYAQIQRT